MLHKAEQTVDRAGGGGVQWESRGTMINATDPQGA